MELEVKSCDKLEGQQSNFNTVRSSAFSSHSDYTLSLHISPHYCGVLITSVKNPDMLVMWGENILQCTYANKQMSVLVTEVFSLSTIYSSYFSVLLTSEWSVLGSSMKISKLWLLISNRLVWKPRSVIKCSNNSHEASVH